MIPYGQTVPGESAEKHPRDLLSQPEAAAALHPPVEARTWYYMVYHGRVKEADFVRFGQPWWYRETVEAVDAKLNGQRQGRPAGAKDSAPRRDRIGEIREKLQADPQAVTLEWIVQRFRGVSKDKAAEMLAKAREEPGVSQKLQNVQGMLPPDPADDPEVVLELIRTWKISRKKAEELVQQAREAM